MMNIPSGALVFLKRRCLYCVQKRHTVCTDSNCEPARLGLNISVVTDSQNTLTRVFVTTSGVHVERIRMNYCTALDADAVKLDAIRKYARPSNDEQNASSEQSERQPSEV